MMQLISVIGGNECNAVEASFAEEMGRLIAARSFGIICGGRSGVMEAVCRGAQEQNGLTIGILPTFDSKHANPYLSVAIPTGLGEARNVIIVLAGEVVLAIGGSFGTLSEIAHALRLGKPVVGFQTWEGRDAIDQELPIHRVQSPDQAIEKIENLLAIKPKV